jgi:hypothetical protein
MLTIATFAATITFTIVFTPGQSGQTTPGLTLLAFANSLFCGAIIGCVVITIGIELHTFQRSRMGQLKEAKERAEKKMNPETVTGWYEWVWLRTAINSYNLLNKFQGSMSWVVQISAGIVGSMLYVAFYLMLYSTCLFLQYNGPFILGSVLYIFFGVVALVSWIWSLVLERMCYGYAVELG